MEGDRVVTVLVSTELLAELLEWSPPVQVQVQHNPDLTPEYTMVFRTTTPPTLEQITEALLETYTQRANHQILAGPEAHCAALAGAVVALLDAAR